MSDEEKQEVKDSNELLNIFLIIIGAIYIFQGLISYIPGLQALMPPVIIDVLADPTGESTAAFQALLSENGLMRTVLGAFCFIAGVGMFQEQEWAWGMSIVLLSVILVTTAGTIISSFISWDNGNLIAFSWWIQFISVAFAALGVLWLLGTKDRYA